MSMLNKLQNEAYHTFRTDILPTLTQKQRERFQNLSGYWYKNLQKVTKNTKTLEAAKKIVDNIDVEYDKYYDRLNAMYKDYIVPLAKRIGWKPMSYCGSLYIYTTRPTSKGTMCIPGEVTQSCAYPETDGTFTILYGDGWDQRLDRKNPKEEDLPNIVEHIWSENPLPKEVA